MSSIKKLAAILVIFLSAVSFFGQQTSRSLSFNSEDDKVVNFATLPQSILALLLNDKEDFPDGPPPNLHCEEHENAGPAPRPEILCRKVAISSHTGTDYLVIGVGDLRGAHIVPFWLFHNDDNGASLLFKTRSNQIEILSKRFNGYAEIRSTWIQGAGALIVTNSFRFNGKSYVRFRKETQHQ